MAYRPKVLEVVNGGTGLASTTANQLLYSSGTSTIAGLATATNSVLVTDGSNVPSISATLPSAVQGNITSTGTIATGTWNGTKVDVAHGGTNAATLTGLLVGNGTSAVTATTFTDQTSWTPNLQINGSNTGITYTTQTGGYSQIGNVVVFWLNVTLSSKGAGSGNVTISNFPVSTGASGSNIFLPVTSFSIWTATANYTVMSIQLANNSAIGTLIESAIDGSASANVTAAQIGNTFLIRTSGSYLLD